MKLKRICALLTSALMAASLLTACGGTAPAEANSTEGAEGPITLKLTTWDYTSTPAFKVRVEAFEKSHPNIKLEVIDIPAADYTTKLTTMLNGGADFDLLFVKDSDTTKSLADKGQLLDLTDRISSEGIDLSVYNGLADNFNFDGKQYAIPDRTDYYVMYYNKDIFDAHQMEYPSNDWTWGQFEEMAKQLTGDGKYGAYIHTWQACVQNWSLQDGKHTIMDYETGYDFFKPYYEMVLRMQEAGSIQDYGALKAAKIHYSGPFAQGNVAMMPMGTWFMSTMIDKVKNGESTVNWGVATLPHPEGVEAGWVVGAATPMAINAKTKHADAAWEVMKFFTGEEGADLLSQVGQFPACADERIINQIAENEGMPENVGEALRVKHISLDRPIVDKVSEVNQMLGEQHSMIMLGQGSLDEVLAEMASQAKDILAD